MTPSDPLSAGPAPWRLLDPRDDLAIGDVRHLEAEEPVDVLEEALVVTGELRGSYRSRERDVPGDLVAGFDVDDGHALG